MYIDRSWASRARAGDLPVRPRPDGHVPADPDASKIANGKKMLGMVVEVYTSDDQRFLYEITEVRRHQLDLEDA